MTTKQQITAEELKAVSLMIGNWVAEPYSSIPEKVSKIEYCEINGWCVNDEVIGYFKPIELTPEILEMCGFVNQPMADLGAYIYLPLSETSDICLSWWNGTIWIGEHDTGIKYLHELQNIVKSITGKNLTLTP